MSKLPWSGFDEVTDITLKQYRAMLREIRRNRAKSGWLNWHINHNRFSYRDCAKYLRQISYRRAH